MKLNLKKHDQAKDVVKNESENDNTLYFVHLELFIY